MMSARAERIRTFKHAQITRIKKEEEEEWLSGEELCTEGSSDEETSHKSKLRQIPTKQTDIEAQKVSPFAEKTATAPSSARSLSEDGDSSRTCKCESDKDMNLVETLETDEYEVVWRPKRGSLQLPNSCSEEQNRLTACYTEVLQTLQFLKPSNYKHYQNSTEELEINNTAEDYQIDILIQSIKGLDVKLKEEHKLWKDAEQERRDLEQEIRKSLLESSFLWEKNSEFLMHICNNIEGASDAKTHNEETAVNEVEKKVSVESSNDLTNTNTKDFITRNIEFAKNGVMATFSLTEEEQSKLETLLSDIDDEEYQQQKAKVEISEHVDENDLKELVGDDEEHVNQFKLTFEEQRMMSALEAKMEEMLDAFPKQIQDDQEDENETTFDDPLQYAVESGRLWKFAEMNERIKDIDKKLESLRAIDQEECEDEVKDESETKDE